mmetsp:Transcript_30858/g.86688  ORF Transcript_30858/g.86688 Transcript_30858/m.86688 type:complete len:204 (-) Transcript_30858:2-613(-)
MKTPALDGQTDEEASHEKERRATEIAACELAHLHDPEQRVQDQGQEAGDGQRKDLREPPKGRDQEHGRGLRGIGPVRVQVDGQEQRQEERREHQDAGLEPRRLFGPRAALDLGGVAGAGGGVGAAASPRLLGGDCGDGAGTALRLRLCVELHAAASIGRPRRRHVQKRGGLHDAALPTAGAHRGGGSCFDAQRGNRRAALTLA